MRKRPRRHRRRALGLLRDLMSRTGPSRGRKPLRAEPLEDRLLLASDWGWSAESLDGPANRLLAEGESSAPPVVFAATDTSAAEGEQTPAPDLVAFAQAVSASGAKMYGAAWCAACNAQKALFEDGGDFMPFIESTNPDRTQNQAAIDAGITAYPTWVFPDDTREVGMLTLETIATRSGVSIPTSVEPFVAPLEDQVVYGGSPLHIGLNGYDPNQDALTYTVSSSDPTLVSATVLAGNRSARVNVSGWGEMVFELFEGRVPRATGQFIALADAGFYDAETYTSAGEAPIIVHRVVDNFMMQFGDPTGTGTSGSNLDDFDDQFHVDLQHNTKGALSWAKGGDDTNNSQVFVTDVATRGLDFNHSYFGQLTEGDKVRDAITGTEVIGVDDDGTLVNEEELPTYSIVIDSVEIFTDNENAVLMLKAAEGASGQADITVTVTDTDGNEYVETFQVTVEADPYNGGPFLGEIGAVQTTVNTPATFQLTSTDVEGDAVTYEAAKIGTVDYTYTIDANTGEVEVTPPTGFTGELEILVGVRPTTQSDTFDTFDTQVVPVQVALGTSPDVDPPAGVDLEETSDTGYLNDDELTRATSLDFTVDGVVDGALVRLYQGGTLLGQATAIGTTALITTSSLNALGDGTYAVYATQEVDGTESAASSSLDVTLDQTPPPAFTSNPPAAITVGQQLVYNAENPEEGAAGASYSLQNEPGSLDIDPDDGTVTWTPVSADAGAHQFSVVIEDGAGNETAQQVTLNVIDDDTVAFYLTVTDTAGNPIDSVQVGDDFHLNVFVEDLRFAARGVFAAFLDVLYDETLVGVDGTLVYGDEFSPISDPGLSTAGLIDEAGGISGLQDLGGDQYLLFSVPMQATGVGTADFTADPADDPDNEVLILGSNDAVPIEKIFFDTAALTIEVAFGANDDLFSVDEDSGATTLDVLGNDEQLPGSPGELIITDAGASPAGGIIEIATDGKSIYYAPPADFFGEDTFTYTISDGTGSQQATVTVQVQPLNDDPLAVDDTFTVAEDTVDSELDVLANDDIAPDADEELEVTSVGATSAGGTVEITADGSGLLYTPASNFFGSETFTYTIGDGHGGTATATVTVTVTETNDPPTAQDDSIPVDEDSVDNVLDVLANDDTADPDETLTIVDVTDPEFGGQVTIAADGLSLLYTPADDFFGAERFTYTISDGNDGMAQAVVTMIVAGTNDPPTATDDDFTVVKDTGPQTLDVLANDSSQPDGDEPLSISSVTTATAGGQVTIAADGLSVQYTPAAGYTGADSFTYTIEDGNGGEATATVTIDVRDFIPSSLSGYVYLDVDNDGHKDSTETPLGGVVITLAGTDLFDTPVTQTQTTDARGYYEFTDLAPGDYTLTETQPAMLLDGIVTAGSQGGTVAENQIIVQLEQDTAGEQNNFAERGRVAHAISLADFFTTTPRDSVLTTANGEEGTGWYAIEGGWDHARTMKVLLAEDDTARLLVQDTDGLQYTATLHLDDATEVDEINATTVMRIVASPTTLFPDSGCPCADGESAGEGEANPAVTFGGYGAEGEASPLAGGDPALAAAETFVARPLTATDPARLAALPSQPAVAWQTGDRQPEVVTSAPPVTLASAPAVDQVMANAEIPSPLAEDIDLPTAAEEEADFLAAVDALLSDAPPADSELLQ